MRIIGPATCWLLAVLLLAAVPASAVTVPDLYEAAVPVTSSRDAAFADALSSVVIRVSGRPDAPARMGSALKNPRQYAQRFGFTADNVLQVTFDDVSVDRLLTDAGLPVWGRERPMTLVFLNVARSDGSSFWIDSGTGSTERQAMDRAAKLRGLPIVWPDMTSQDRMQLNVDTGGGDEPSGLLQIAARYNANAVLLGSSRSDGAGGTSIRWTLASAEGTQSSVGSLDEGVTLAADTFAQAYSASGTSLDSVSVQVSGINNLGAYATILNYLEGLTLVRSVAVEQVVGDTLKFRLAVRGDSNTLRRAMALDGRFVPDSPAEAAPSPGGLQFRYQP